MKKRILSMLLVAALAITSLAGCGGSTGSSSGSAETSEETSEETGEEASEETVSITIASPTALESFDHAVIYVAQAMGYFEEEGLNVTLADGTGKDTKMVSAGQAQFSYPSPGLTLAAIEAGLDIVAVCNWDVVNIFGFAVGKDSGIASWEDFKGKSIALGDASWQSIAEPILAKAGIGAEDVTWEVVGDSRFQAVATGQCDILFTWLCEYGQCIGQGYDFSYFDGNEQIPQLSNGLVTSRAYAEENPDVVKKMTKAYTKAIYFCYANPEAAADTVLAKCPSLEMDKEAAISAMEYCVKSFFGMTEEAQKAYIESGIGLYEEEPWKLAIESSLASGTITKEIDASTVYTNDYVVNDWDKTEVEEDAAAYEFQSAQFK